MPSASSTALTSLRTMAPPSERLSEANTAARPRCRCVPETWCAAVLSRCTRQCSTCDSSPPIDLGDRVGEVLLARLARVRLDDAHLRVAPDATRLRTRAPNGAGALDRNSRWIGRSTTTSGSTTRTAPSAASAVFSAVKPCMAELDRAVPERLDERRVGAERSRRGWSARTPAGRPSHRRQLRREAAVDEHELVRVEAGHRTPRRAARRGWRAPAARRRAG